MIYSIDADVALLNEHGCKADQRIKIFNYSVHQCNSLNEKNSGCAIAIRNNIRYQVKDDFESDILSITVETTLGPIVIATAYIPPRVGYLHYPDYFSVI